MTLEPNNVIYNVEFDKIYLNEELAMKLKSVILNHTYSQASFETSRTLGKLYTPGSLWGGGRCFSEQEIFIGKKILIASSLFDNSDRNSREISN